MRIHNPSLLLALGNDYHMVMTPLINQNLNEFSSPSKTPDPHIFIFPNPFLGWEQRLGISPAGTRKFGNFGWIRGKLRLRRSCRLPLGAGGAILGRFCWFLFFIFMPGKNPKYSILVFIPALGGFFLVFPEFWRVGLNKVILFHFLGMQSSLGFFSKSHSLKIYFLF